MKLAAHRRRRRPRSPPPLVDDDAYVDLSDVVDDFDEAFFGAGGLDRDPARGGRARGGGPADPFAGERIGAPIARPHQILCIGLNYSDHAAETGQAVPDEPILFTKSPNTLVGPNDDVRIPRGSTKPDWEVELGIVIGRRTSYLDTRRGGRATRSPATCVVNDVSERAFQIERGGQWVKGKSAETFNPAGPWLVTPDEIADVLDLDMWLDVNGVRRQTGNTATMVFDPYFIVHYLSQFLVLEPGDLINTGTPPGVGMGLDPPIWLQPGDVMELGIDGLGAQRQHGARAPMSGRCGRSSSPARARRGPGRARAGGRPRARWSSTSSGSASAAPTSSSSPARWRTCTRATPRTRCGSATSGGHRHGGRRRRRPRLDRPPGHRRHHARVRQLPRCRRGHQHVCEHRHGGRHPRRPSGRAGRAARRAGHARCTRCPTRSTRCSAQWSSRAATPARRSRRPSCGRGPGARPRSGDDRPAGGDVRPRGRRRGPPDGPRRATRSRSRAALGFDDVWTEDDAAGAALGCGDRRLERRRTCPRSRWSWWSPAGRVVYIGLPGSPA